MLLCSRSQAGALLPLHASLGKALCVPQVRSLSADAKPVSRTMSLLQSLCFFPTQSQKKGRGSCHCQQQETSFHMGSYCGVDWELAGVLQILHHTSVIKHTLNTAKNPAFSLYWQILLYSLAVLEEFISNRSPNQRN